MAATHCNLVVTRVAGKTSLTVRGPETRSTKAECPADGEWVGIQFKLGAFEIAFAVATGVLVWIGLFLRDPRLFRTIVLRQQRRVTRAAP
jgi:hypothetical protein